MTNGSSQDREDARRQAILAAARGCFLQFGYDKTSLDDVAQRAGISRPLIYRKFRNKEEILSAVFEAEFEASYPKVEAVLSGRGEKREKLTRAFELLMVEPWAALIDAPMASELTDACERILPEVQERHWKRCVKYAQAVLGSKDVAEVFILAADGLVADMPGVPALRKRLALLIERFT